MANLFRSLFESFGHVYQSPRYKKDTGTYEWNLSTIVDSSFDFLLEDKAECWKWVQQKESTTISYIAGIVDAEGSIGIWPNGKGTALQVVVYNTNLDLLQAVKCMISNLGYIPLGPYLDKPKGSVTSKYKIPRRKDYHKIALAVFEQVQRLIDSLPLRHAEKVLRKELALCLAIGDDWNTVEPRITQLRNSFTQDRDSFVKLAEETYIQSHRT